MNALEQELEVLKHRIGLIVLGAFSVVLLAFMAGVSLGELRERARYVGELHPCVCRGVEVIEQ